MYVARNGLRMLRHTFRRTTLGTWLGLESQRDAFRRYEAIRRAEREVFAEVKGGGPGRANRWQAGGGEAGDVAEGVEGRRVGVREGEQEIVRLVPAIEPPDAVACCRLYFIGPAWAALAVRPQ